MTVADVVAKLAPSQFLCFSHLTCVVWFQCCWRDRMVDDTTTQLEKDMLFGESVHLCLVHVL